VDANAPTRVSRALALLAELKAHRRLMLALQVGAILVVLALCALAVESEWTKAEPRLEDANLTDVGLAVVAVAAYYLVFILGWIRMLDAWGIRISYRVALQAEMVSMLAKYVPGGVWTPAARAVALRRNAGVTDTPTVLASILVEAGLSAISGVIVFVVSLAWVHGVNAPLPVLIAFAVLLAALLHPRIFRPLSERVLKPFGAHGVDPLPFRITVELLLFYCATWVLGGLGLYFLLRGVGANPGWSNVAFLGGTSAIGAIVAVVVVVVPSGLGVREGAMYAFLTAIVPSSAAVDATILNRLVITAVELALFGAGVLAWRGRRRHEEAEAAATEA
jgi:glycosyltransferase 2 family protein